MHACGTAYCAKESAGDLAVGHFSSTNYQAQAGFNTDRLPYIECTVNNPNADLGTLTPTSTKTTTTTFSVKAYLSHGYDVVEMLLTHQRIITIQCKILRSQVLPSAGKI